MWHTVRVISYLYAVEKSQRDEKTTNEKDVQTFDWCYSSWKLQEQTVISYVILSSTPVKAVSVYYLKRELCNKK